MELETHEPLGVSVTGLPIEAVDEHTVTALKRLLAERGVLVLPGQHAGDAAFVTFLSQFGTLVFTTGEAPVEGFADLNVVSNVGRKTAPRSVFHTDSSYLCLPPTYTALRAVAIPARGGQTEFTNQYNAFETLPADLRAQLDGRSITHVVTGLELAGEDESYAEHPVFQLHPISSRTAVYMSTPQRCAAVSGYSSTESAELIDRLFTHSTRPDNTFRHSWSAGDIVIWDNRCVLHRGDHSDVVGDRVMHRGMVTA